MFAYHTVDSIPATGLDKGKNTFVSLGNRFKFGEIMVDFDYLMNSYKDASDTATFAFAGKTVVVVSTCSCFVDSACHYSYVMIAH